MGSLLIRGGLLVTPKEERFGEILVQGDKILSIGSIAALSEVSKEVLEIDATNCYVTPGLIDLQVNGGPECDFWEELSQEKIAAFSKRLITSGVTSILPTLITGDLKRLKKNRDFLKPLLGLPQKQSGGEPLLRMPGVHFEGPCLSPKKPGVHPPEHLQPLEIGVIKELIDEACRLITLAPELDPSGNCLSYLKEHSVVCSLGHSNANFEEAKLAFSRGVSVMTHTFNALPALHHREPGAVTAALLERKVSCCVIPDGLHVSPAVVDLIFRIKGAEKTILVSDMAAIGTSQGGLVGSSLVLDQGVRNMVDWGICSFADAVTMSTFNPARLLQIEHMIGQLCPGAFADIILWNRDDLSIKQLVYNGELVKRSELKTLIC